MTPILGSVPDKFKLTPQNLRSWQNRRDSIPSMDCGHKHAVHVMQNSVIVDTPTDFSTAQIHTVVTLQAIDSNKKPIGESFDVLVDGHSPDNGLQKVGQMQIASYNGVMGRKLLDQPVGAVIVVRAGSQPLMIMRIRPPKTEEIPDVEASLPALAA